MKQKINTLQCDCGDWYAHTLNACSVDYGDDDQYLYIVMALNHYLPFWKRVVIGFKYIFAIQDTHCQFVELVTDKEKFRKWTEDILFSNNIFEDK